MKLYMIFAASMFFIPPIFSQPQQTDVPLISRQVVEGRAPIRVDAEYETFRNARFFKPHSQRHNHLSIAMENVLASYRHAISKDSGFTLGVGYLGVNFDFDKHKYFDQQQFNNALFNIGGFTKEVEGWKWKLDILTQINTEHFSLSRYAFFTGLLKGKYAWHEKRNLHVGILAYTGMRYSRALPVLGFDYKLTDRFRLNMIYPLNVSLQFFFNKNISFEAGVRYFLTRQRLQGDDKLPRGFVAFRTWSTELGINWVYNDLIEFNAHIGESLANRMRVSNRKDKHRKHLRMKDAPGFGFVASVKF